MHVDTTGYLLGNRAPAVVQLRSLLGAPVVTGHGGKWQFYLIPGSGPVHDVKNRNSLSSEARKFFYPDRLRLEGERAFVSIGSRPRWDLRAGLEVTRRRTSL